MTRVSVVASSRPLAIGGAALAAQLCQSVVGQLDQASPVINAEEKWSGSAEQSAPAALLEHPAPPAEVPRFADESLSSPEPVGAPLVASAGMPAMEADQGAQTGPRPHQSTSYHYSASYDTSTPAVAQHSTIAQQPIEPAPASWWGPSFDSFFQEANRMSEELAAFSKSCFENLNRVAQQTQLMGENIQRQTASNIQRLRPSKTPVNYRLTIKNNVITLGGDMRINDRITHVQTVENLSTRPDLAALVTYVDGQPVYSQVIDRICGELEAKLKGEFIIDNGSAGSRSEYISYSSF